jgi:hypothetical protein
MTDTDPAGALRDLIKGSEVIVRGPGR